MPKNSQSSHAKNKMSKKKLMIISEPYAHFHTTKITPAMFQKGQSKIIGGVTVTNYPNDNI